MTHRYLDTGEITGYYALEYRQTEDNVRAKIPVMFYLVTKEMCGIDSPELPRFFPRNERLSEDKDAVRSYLKKTHWRLGQEALDSVVANWEENLLPVIKWHNKFVKNEAPESPLYRAV